MKLLNGINVRRMNRSDAPFLSALFSEVYGRKISSSYFEWRFFKNPLKKNWAFVAESKDKIKGLATLTPLPIFFEGEKLIVGVSGASMVHPSIQRRGIYTKLANHMYDVAYDEGCEFICGFPNNNSHYGRIKKLGWFDIYEIPNFSKTTDLSCIEKSTDGELTLITKSDLQKINYNWEIEKKVSESLLCLSQEILFLDWRFNHPLHKYYIFRCKNFEGEVLIKYFIKEEDQKEIDILLINSKNKKELLKLIQCLISFSAANNIFKINMWLNHSSNNYQLFESLGFKHESPITWFSGKQIKGTNSIFSHYKNWDICFAMSDIY